MVALVACVCRATLAVLTVAAAECAATTTTTTTTTDDGRAAGRGKVYTGNSSETLAQSLRRQLMEDNYDYMSTEESEDELSESRFHIQRSRNDEDVSDDKIVVATVLDGEVRKKHAKDKISSQEKDENKNIAGKHKGRRNLFRGSIRRRKKIHKYMNDGDADVVERYRSRHRYNADDDRSVADHQPPDSSDTTQQASTVKYKVLKLRSGYRRSGQAAALIQEQSAQGVAVVKLGAGPFPEFRLPAPRRQYMSGPRPLRPLRPLDDEELPPPPLDQPDPSTPATNADPLNTIRQAEPYFNNEENSLKITVTPDEILVL